MTTWLIRHFVKNHTQTTENTVREAYGTLGASTGIAVNVLLSAVKFLLGIFSGSLAVTADAVNNLSDAAGSVMSLISVRLAAKPQDKEHPFGHGRMEYIGALAVGLLIVLAGGKLLLSGVDAIMHPAALTASWPVMVLLAASVLVKLWLFFYYRTIARIIDSKPLAAAANDSISDVAATSAVLISVILQTLLDWRIDGYIGVLVALFVLKTGIDVCKDTVDRLLGEKPNPQLTLEIKNKLLSYEGIRGVHDLVVHDYGPGRCIASVHAEVSATGDIVAVHETVDRAERDLKNDLGIVVCIHMDPTVTDDPAVNEAHRKMAAFLQNEDKRLTLHDFRMVPGQLQVNLVFDCLLPDDYPDREGLRRKLAAYAKQLDPRYEIVVQFDTDFT
ncbi:MAG: cation diffusion facilitator family transporter [Eubacteriales bacterium]|nr:cation diffusion facilitator family transporter [Eubacteriales bacterium]